MTDKPRIISAIADVKFTFRVWPETGKMIGWVKTVKCFIWNPNYTTPKHLVENERGFFRMMSEKRDE